MNTSFEKNASSGHPSPQRPNEENSDKRDSVQDMFSAIKPTVKRQRNTQGQNPESGKDQDLSVGTYGGQMQDRDFLDVEEQEQSERTQKKSNHGQFRGNRQSLMDESCFKKQMEMRSGKCHQLITDQEQNSNRIFANRYIGRGWVGLWYFVIDCIYHFENLLLCLVLVIIIYAINSSTTSSSELSIPLYFPITALAINIFLMATRNTIFEMRQRKVTQKINTKTIQYLNVTRFSSKFAPITWEKIRPGHIIRITRGEEFPADCLVLDIQGQSGQKCYVTCGPFDDSTSIMQKKSFSATSNKTGKVQNESHLADMISGQLKFEYNYFGYIMGSFKLNENPQAHDFDHENVVQRGTFLRNTPQAICLVLNVGNQCIGSIYKDPKKYMMTSTDQVLTSFVKTQRSFDKAYKQSIRVFLISLTVLFVVISFGSVYISTTMNFSNVTPFEEKVMGSDTQSFRFFLDKCLGCLLILLSSLPFSFSNIIHLLVLLSTNFAEWDVDVIPANINFRHPHATLAFGKVAHMFLSRNALQRDDKQCVKLLWIGRRFYKNQYSIRAWEQMKSEQQRDVNQSFRESADEEDQTFKRRQNVQDQDWQQDQGETELDYFPNELKFSSTFTNEEMDDILNSDPSQAKDLMPGDATMGQRRGEVTEFLRSLCLCHQVYVQHDYGLRVKQKERSLKYIGIFNDEIATVDFASRLGFKLYQRKRKLMTLEVQGVQERYEELGIVTTKAVMGHFMTIAAVKVVGTSTGILYMKGSLASLKHYFARKESDLQYLNEFQDRFIQSGLKAIVYAKRILTLEETNQLIITLNEGVSTTKENGKIEILLRQLTNKECQILGILGVQKSIHLRNRVVIDDMVLNGVKPWIISMEPEQSHLTSLNSIRLFQGCAEPFMITGRNQKIVSEQIMTSLRTVIERLEEYQQKDIKKKEIEKSNRDNISRRKDLLKQQGAKHSRLRRALNWMLGIQSNQDDDLEAWKQQYEQLNHDRRRMELKEKEMQILQTEKSHQNLRNCVVFTGPAMNEIQRDITLQKSFMTLAYLSDMLIGSEIKPLQKQKLVVMAKNFIGEGEYTACVVTTPEDQFMINDADLCVNLKDRSKSTDFQAVVDVSIKDLSAISYLLFKHGNQIQQRLSKAVQAFFYFKFISLLIMVTYLMTSAFSAAIPFKDTYYLVFMLIFAPVQILVYGVFFKNYGNEYYYRIFGHYKYNFSFALIEFECIISDLLRVGFDWIVLYIPFQLLTFQNSISTDGKATSIEAYQCHQVLLLEAMLFCYFNSTTQVILYSLYVQLMFTVVGCALVFDDQGLSGVTEFFQCPYLMMVFFWQVMMLTLRNYVADVAQKLVIKKWADLLDWYVEVEERLAFEEFENINQIVTIHQFRPLYKKINSSNIERTLKLINKNMIRVTKSQELEQILEKINSELDYTRRGQVALTGTIDKITLKFNDLNKEAEYQENKNGREIAYIRKQMNIFVITTLLFGLLGLILRISAEYTNVGVIYYLILSAFTATMNFLLPYLKHHLSKVLLAYTIIVIACYSVYTSQAESLQPCGLIFVLALVAGLNHSFVYPTILMIMLSVLGYIFFSLVSKSNITETANSTISGYRSFMWVLTGLCWSGYVYFQELEKKIQFVRSHQKVRNLIKLKKILNILVPSLVRDKIASGKRNFADEEGEATIVFIDIHHFDDITQSYSPKELVQLLDMLYNQFDSFCDQYGIQKIESVGKRYMACGGLKSADKRVEQSFLNKHHSVRVTDFAIEIVNFCKQVFLKSGQHLEVRVGIHTGVVVSVVVGDIKPQFSLIGATVNRTSHICRYSPPLKVTISAQTQHYLNLYTNNLSFSLLTGRAQSTKLAERVFIASKSRAGVRNQFDTQTLGTPTLPATQAMMAPNADNIGKYNYDKDPLTLNTDEMQETKAFKAVDSDVKKKEKDTETDSEVPRNLDLDSMDEGTEANVSNDNSDVRHNQQEYQNNITREQFDNDSQKSDRENDDDKMNVFGFNDDLGPQLDDRIIIQNPTELAKYNVVERPKYLLTFEARESESEFLFRISKQEGKKTSILMFMLLVLNKLIILGDMLEHGTFTITLQFVAMFPITILEIILIYKLNNPTKNKIAFWTTMLLLYGVLVFTVLISLEVKYLGNWQRCAFNELLFELTLSLFFMMRNIFLRHFVICYGLYLIVLLALIVIEGEKIFAYQALQIFLGQIMYFILLCIGIHHREMIQRKSINYERILTYEGRKTNDLISNLIPIHLLNVIISEKRQVDVFDEITLLYVDIPGFVDYHKDIVRLLSRLFTRFDQLSIENKVYKVQTIGDCYIIMGYSGRVEQNARSQVIRIDECDRVVNTGLQMLNCVSEIKKSFKNFQAYNEDLNVRVGIHSGTIVAGIIGTKLVKYDIFGENVLTAYKVKSNTPKGQVNVTEETKNLLSQAPKIMRNYEFVKDVDFHIPSINRHVQTYSVSWREVSDDSEDSENSHGLSNNEDSQGNDSDQWHEENHSHGSDDFDLLKRRKALGAINAETGLARKKKIRQHAENIESADGIETEREVLLKAVK